MAETRREWDALMALLATNGAGGVDATDLRDACYTLLPSIGIIYIASGAEVETGLGTTNWTKSAGTTTNLLLDSFSMPANNRLTYTGTPVRRVIVGAFCSTETAASARTLDVGIYFYDLSAISGDVLVESPISKYHADANPLAVSTFGTCLMDTGDYLELHIKNSAADNATVNNMILVAIGIPRLV